MKKPGCDKISDEDAKDKGFEKNSNPQQSMGTRHSYSSSVQVSFLENAKIIGFSEKEIEELENLYRVQGKS